MVRSSADLTTQTFDAALWALPGSCFWSEVLGRLPLTPVATLRSEWLPGSVEVHSGLVRTSLQLYEWRASWGRVAVLWQRQRAYRDGRAGLAAEVGEMLHSLGCQSVIVLAGVPTRFRFTQGQFGSDRCLRGIAWSGKVLDIAPGLREVPPMEGDVRAAGGSGTGLSAVLRALGGVQGDCAAVVEYGDECVGVCEDVGEDGDDNGDVSRDGKGGSSPKIVREVDKMVSAMLSV